MDVGKHVKRLRLRNNMTQKDLSKRLDELGFRRGESTISAWEIGDSNPPLDDREFSHALANALGLTHNMLWLELGYVDRVDYDLTRDELRLLNALREGDGQEAAQAFAMLLSRM